MFESLVGFLSSEEVLKAGSIPVIAALIGWSTNWLAIQMTFYPLEFVGIRPFFGWQGIVPRKRKKMAERFVDNTLSRVSSVRDLYSQMNPELIEAHLYQHLEAHLDDHIDALMREHHPVIWSNLPGLARRKVYADAHSLLPATIHALMQEVDERIDELVDLRALVVERLCEDKSLLIRVFQECGEQEFAFIIRSGWYLGFLFGLGQLWLWQCFPYNWTLPVCGFVVGAATNWVALTIIFKPLEPVGIGSMKLQGLFLQRQACVAATLSRIIANELLTTRLFVHAMFYGTYRKTTRALASKHLCPALDSRFITKTLAQLSLGFRGYSELKHLLVDRALDVSVDPFEDVQFNEERAVAVEQMICTRMENMSSSQFQDVLRPVFSEDEWILIAIGGFLGVCAGLLQIVWLAV